jgi:phosphomannomutase/phosphoglucomutase
MRRSQSASNFVIDVDLDGTRKHRPPHLEKGLHSRVARHFFPVKLPVFARLVFNFFNKPFGRGYDDGLIFTFAVCDMLDRNPDKSMADLKNALPKTWSSPTMSPYCADEEKYGVVDAVVKHFEAEQKTGGKVAGQPIRDLVTVNGVRVTVEDGTWGLVRASSNKPELVVVVESPVSEARMRDMFKSLDAVLRTHKEVGEYNQTI